MYSKKTELILGFHGCDKKVRDYVLNSFYDADYPALSEAMRHFKEDEEGVMTVCKIIEEYGTSEVRKAMEQVVVNLFHEGVPVSTIAKSAGITEEEALEIRDKALQPV
ncbi:MAG: hypothetical protein E7294_06980 [Lachnospiraceae bacterium]|nr:hypothetical protein [Lachnospiraceae bacterium]